MKYRKQLDSTSVRVSLYAIFVQIWFVIYGYSGNGIYDANEFFFYIMAIAMMIAVVQESKDYDLMNVGDCEWRGIGTQ